MKKLIIVVLVLFVLLIGGLSITSCTSQETTTVVSGTSSTTTIVLVKEPPEIPHPFLQGIPGVPFVVDQEPICFVCHPVPPQHEDWWADVGLCGECHVESENQILVEPGR